MVLSVSVIKIVSSAGEGGFSVVSTGTVTDAIVALMDCISAQTAADAAKTYCASLAAVASLVLWYAFQLVSHDCLLSFYSEISQCRMCYNSNLSNLNPWPRNGILNRPKNFKSRRVNALVFHGILDTTECKDIYRIQNYGEMIISGSHSSA